MIFETDRLLVRRLSERDLDGFHDMQSNPEVMRHVGGRAMTLEENVTDLRSLIAAYTTPKNDFWVWAVERRSDGAFLGTCALVVNGQDEHEIGFRFREKFWGNGYGKELIPALLQYGLTKMDLRRLVAYVDRDNAGSVRILERYMSFEMEFYNDKEKCIDRKYISGNAG